MKKYPTITIDGPAASGKGTVAKAISKRLDIPYVNSGGVFRALAYIIHLSKKEHQDFLPEDVNSLIKQYALTFEKGTNGSKMKITMEGRDITQNLYDSEVTELTPKLGSHLSFIEVGSHIIQKVGQDGGVIDSRVAGTVLFPDADVKIFLTASLEARSQRRFQDLMERGEKVTLSEVTKDVQNRDEFDETRQNDPLKIAKDAVIVDSTGQSEEETIKQVLSIVEGKLANSKL